MEHFKKFLIKLQTFNINLTIRKKNADSYPHNTREVQYFDLSHENPDLSRSFKSEVKELSELAVTDLLNLAPSQISLQLIFQFHKILRPKFASNLPVKRG